MHIRVPRSGQAHGLSPRADEGPERQERHLLLEGIHSGRLEGIRPGGVGWEMPGPASEWDLRQLHSALSADAK
jgi:hypothetical protein